MHSPRTDGNEPQHINEEIYKLVKELNASED